MERFRAIQQGQNFHSLDDSLKSTYKLTFIYQAEHP